MQGTEKTLSLSLSLSVLSSYLRSNKCEATFQNPFSLCLSEGENPFWLYTLCSLIHGFLECRN
ncbi:hypothetical protein RHGRI_023914 [Rhododendron griersonianum]|uniref:Uncharacterized protein n=1 Tax=Rhododendron griersonianum TaxID=479676 RepID=A0AAV6J7K9_9ERIC|nr:hypothetical protein RHGRI_023914 [Rhododendron griersonianum]